MQGLMNSKWALFTSAPDKLGFLVFVSTLGLICMNTYLVNFMNPYSFKSQ